LQSQKKWEELQAEREEESTLNSLLEGKGGDVSVGWYRPVKGFTVTIWPEHREPPVLHERMLFSERLGLKNVNYSTLLVTTQKEPGEELFRKSIPAEYFVTTPDSWGDAEDADDCMYTANRATALAFLDEIKCLDLTTENLLGIINHFGSLWWGSLVREHSGVIRESVFDWKHALYDMQIFLAVALGDTWEQWLYPADDKGKEWHFRPHHSEELFREVPLKVPDGTKKRSRKKLFRSLIMAYMINEQYRYDFVVRGRVVVMGGDHAGVAYEERVPRDLFSVIWETLRESLLREKTKGGGSIQRCLYPDCGKLLLYPAPKKEGCTGEFQGTSTHKRGDGLYYHESCKKRFERREGNAKAGGRGSKKYKARPETRKKEGKKMLLGEDEDTKKPPTLGRG